MELERATVRWKQACCKAEPLPRGLRQLRQHPLDHLPRVNRADDRDAALLQDQFHHRVDALANLARIFVGSQPRSDQRGGRQRHVRQLPRRYD